MRHEQEHHTRRLAAALITAATLGLAACQGSGRPEQEAPAQGAGAPAQTASGGDVDSSGFRGLPAGQGLDTMARPGVAGSGTAAIGAPTGSIHTPGSGTLHSGDPSDAGVRALVQAINGAETETARLALQKASSPAVKQYAQRMLDEHRGGASVTASAPGDASDLLVPLRDGHAKAMQALRAAPAGAGFDRMYAQMEVAHHGNALQLIERARTAARDDALVQQLRTLQSTVERHRSDAERLRAQVGGGAS